MLLQIQHPRWGLDQFDMVITPLHDYHALSPAARQEVPKLILPWLTPQHPPDKHVVSSLWTFFELLTMLCLLLFTLCYLFLFYSIVWFLSQLSLKSIFVNLSKFFRTGADSWGFASRRRIDVACSCYYLAVRAGPFGKASADR